MPGYIYRITNSVNNNVYIGSTMDALNRFTGHISDHYFGRGITSGIIFKEDYLGTKMEIIGTINFNDIDMNDSLSETEKKTLRRDKLCELETYFLYHTQYTVNNKSPRKYKCPCGNINDKTFPSHKISKCHINYITKHDMKYNITECITINDVENAVNLYEIDRLVKIFRELRLNCILKLKLKREEERANTETLVEIKKSKIIEDERIKRELEKERILNENREKIENYRIQINCVYGKLVGIEKIIEKMEIWEKMPTKSIHKIDKSKVLNVMIKLRQRYKKIIYRIGESCDFEIDLDIDFSEITEKGKINFDDDGNIKKRYERERYMFLDD